MAPRTAPTSLAFDRMAGSTRRSMSQAHWEQIASTANSRLMLRTKRLGRTNVKYAWTAVTPATRK